MRFCFLLALIESGRVHIRCIHFFLGNLLHFIHVLSNVMGLETIQNAHNLYGYVNVTIDFYYFLNETEIRWFCLQFGYKITLYHYFFTENGRVTSLPFLRFINSYRIGTRPESYFIKKSYLKENKGKCLSVNFVNDSNNYYFV